MQGILERFRPVLKTAMEQYLNDVLNERLSKAMKQSGDEHETSPEKQDEPQNVEPTPGAESPGIITTEEEKEAYYLVKSLLLNTVEPKRVFLRDHVSFCNILLDNSIQRPLLRLHFNRKPWRIGFFDTDTRDDRVEIETLDDIICYADRIKGAALKYEKKD